MLGDMAASPALTAQCSIIFRADLFQTFLI